MSLTAGVQPVESVAPRDPRHQRARTDPLHFLTLITQLTLLLAVFHVFRIEQFGPKDSGFFLMSAIAFGAFAVHYWLPFRFKERFWIGVSLVSAAALLDWRVMLGLFGAGAAFYLVLSRDIRYHWRIGLVAASFAVAMGACATGHFMHFWAPFGSIFMFRMIIYAHDLRYMKGRPPLNDYLAYFFLLPNHYFQFFPVIDYTTMRVSYYRRDINEVAQQGVWWICRGASHLILYRIVYYLRDITTVHSLGSLLWYLVVSFLLYLRVSGQFHIIVGILHLFGYDLPETNHKYLLSRSLMDFWRRINIYWKDFMVKIVYFPVYFRLRKKGILRAQMTGMAAVILVTWVLHSYQSFWLTGKLVFGWTDTLYWGILGILVTANVWMEYKQPARRTAPRRLAVLRQSFSVAVTGLVVVTLWALWNAPTVAAWCDLMSWWKH
jgi:alginate O-acetyltransferase complex protein AlgI